MKYLFLLPAIHRKLTGGNVFNHHIMKALADVAEVEHLVIPDKPELSRQTDMSLQSGLRERSAIMLDSLLLLHGGILRFLSRSGHQSKIFLLVHYLKMLDPAHSGSILANRERKLLSMFDGFILTSDYSRKMMSQSGIPGRALVVIRPGILRDLVPPDEAKSHPAKILTVSSIFPGKGLIEIIKPLENLLDMNWRWTLAGEEKLDQKFSSQFRRKLETSKIEDRCHLTGAVSQEKLFRIYRESTVLVLPSEFETCSMVTMEAMATGLPVVAFDTGGISELIEDEAVGLLVPSGRYDLLGEKLRRLLMESSLREKIAKAALEKSAEFPGWPSSAQILHQFVQDYQLVRNVP